MDSHLHPRKMDIRQHAANHTAMETPCIHLQADLIIYALTVGVGPDLFVSQG